MRIRISSIIWICVLLFFLTLLYHETFRADEKFKQRALRSITRIQTACQTNPAWHNITISGQPLSQFLSQLKSKVDVAYNYKWLLAVYVLLVVDLIRKRFDGFPRSGRYRVSEVSPGP